MSKAPYSEADTVFDPADRRTVPLKQACVIACDVLDLTIANSRDCWQDLDDEERETVRDQLAAHNTLSVVAASIR